MSATLLKPPPADARGELDSLRSSDKVDKVAGPMGWEDAVRRFRLCHFDLIWCEGDRWHGYSLKAGFSGSRVAARTLTEEVYWATLHRSIA